MIDFTVFKYGSPQRQRASHQIDKASILELNISKTDPKLVKGNLPDPIREVEDSALDSRRAVKEEA